MLNHKRTEINDLVGNVWWHLKANALWRYKLSKIYYTPELYQAAVALAEARKLKAA
jgi:hypothetical protein